MLCVIAKLNDAAAEKLAAIREAAFPEGRVLKHLHGHITIATYLGNEEDQFIRSCRELLKDFPLFEIEYEKIEVLEETSIIVATPKKSGQLDLMHQSIAEKYNDSLDVWTQKDRWYPHTTLFYSPEEDLHSICGKMRAEFEPFLARICRIEFSRVCNSGYEIVDHVDLTTRQISSKESSH